MEITGSLTLTDRGRRACVVQLHVFGSRHRHTSWRADAPYCSYRLNVTRNTGISCVTDRPG
jgi:hypothetical protein